MANLWRYDAENEKWLKVSEEDPLPVTIDEDVTVNVDIDSSDIVDVSDLAKDDTLTDGTQKIQIVDSEDGASVDDENDLGVKVNNLNTFPLKIVTDDIISTDLSVNKYTFTEDVDAVAVKNDGTSDLTITIDLLGFTIKPGESRLLELTAFDEVTFSAGASFRMNGLIRGGE